MADGLLRLIGPGQGMVGVLFLASVCAAEENKRGITWMSAAKSGAEDFLPSSKYGIGMGHGAFKHSNTKDVISMSRTIH